MMLVTSLPRILPLVILSKVTIPPLFLQWLKFIPVAVLASLLAPEIFLTDGTLNVSMLNPFLLASIPCFAVALHFRNLFITVFTGMACVILVSKIIAF